MQIPIKLQESHNPYHCQPEAEQDNQQLAGQAGQRGREGDASGNNRQLKRSFKWSYQEHAKYIYFLERNKEKVKSKLVRKSNAFFKEMELYLKTKTSIQCRSHHQKFEEKYRFPHRIISGQKKHIPPHIYQQTVEQTRLQNYTTKDTHPLNNEGINEMQVRKQGERGVEASCQTQLCDLRLQYVLTEGNSEAGRARNVGEYYPYYNPFGVLAEPYFFLY